MDALQPSHLDDGSNLVEIGIDTSFGNKVTKLFTSRYTEGAFGWIELNPEVLEVGEGFGEVGRRSEPFLDLTMMSSMYASAFQLICSCKHFSIMRWEVTPHS